jgi:hypothetical protein
MESRKQQLDRFFVHYEEIFMQSLKEKAPAEEVMSMYAEYFIGSNPKGVMGGRNDEEFGKSLTQGYDFYREIGVTGMYLISQEHALLDDYHALSKTIWRCEFIRKKDNSVQSIEFENYYFVRSENEQLKIFGYITGDEEAVWKDLIQ